MTPDDMKKVVDKTLADLRKEVLDKLFHIDVFGVDEEGNDVLLPPDHPITQFINNLPPPSAQTDNETKEPA